MSLLHREITVLDAELHRLDCVFQKSNALSALLIQLHPENATGKGIEGLPNEFFYNSCWYCPDNIAEFAELNSDISCKIVYIPDDEAIRDDEFERHAQFMAGYFAYVQGNKKLKAIKQYIQCYNMKDNAIYIDPNLQGYEKIKITLMNIMDEPNIETAFYEDSKLRTEIGRVLLATKETPYLIPGADKPFSEETFATLLARLLIDGGETGKTIFYHLSRNPYETDRYIQMYEVVSGLLNRLHNANCIPRIVFNFYIFCVPPPAGKSRHWEQQANYKRQYLFVKDYYGCDLFVNNLKIRKELVQAYIDSEDHSEEELMCARQTKTQLEYLLKLIRDDHYRKIKHIPFHQLIDGIHDTWNELKWLDDNLETIDIVDDVWPIILSYASKKDSTNAYF